MVKATLPPAEMEVLACLDRLGPATAAQIREALQAYRPMAHGSVVTLLKRLEAKKLVTHRKGSVGKAFLYSARREPKGTFRGVVRNLVQRVFHDDPAALVASLFETKPPSAQELDRIEKMVQELRRKSTEEDT
jgi:predicted transcriptional regulator